MDAYTSSHTNLDKRSWQEYHLMQMRITGDYDETYKFQLRTTRQEPATFLDFINNTQHAGFCDLLTNTLNSLNIPAYYWECAPVTSQTIGSAPFEFVVIPAPRLGRKTPNPQDFIAHMTQWNTVVSFPNLSGDADLVIPTLRADNSMMGHLSTFLRFAPPATTRELWRMVAAALQKRLRRAQTVWMSTSGLGVSWLHVRLDATPKYYQYKPYTRNISAKRQVTTTMRSVLQPDELCEERDMRRRASSVSRSRTSLTDIPPPPTKRFASAERRKVINSSWMPHQNDKEKTERPKSPAVGLTFPSQHRSLPLRQRGEVILQSVDKHRGINHTAPVIADFRRRKSSL